MLRCINLYSALYELRNILDLLIDAEKIIDNLTLDESYILTGELVKDDKKPLMIKNLQFLE